MVCLSQRYDGRCETEEVCGWALQRTTWNPYVRICWQLRHALANHFRGIRWYSAIYGGYRSIVGAVKPFIDHLAITASCSAC